MSDAPLRLVVFDMDGTLIDSQNAIVHCMGEAFGAAGLACPPREAVLSIVGLSLPQAMERLAPDAAPPVLARMVADYKHAFVAQRLADGGEASAPLYPGARAALDRLSARDELLMGVATGKARRGLDHTFDAHDLRGYFVTTQTADDHPSKPHPSMLERALAETGTRPDSAVMIGDTSFDIEMGRAAGFRTIGVAWGYHPPQALGAAGADVVIRDFSALDAALDALWT